MRGSGGHGTRLAALLRVDIVGSTATLTHEGLGAAVAQRHELMAVVEQALVGVEGSIVSTEGDGAVLAFVSAVAACETALELRSRFDASPTCTVRLGLSLDEVAVDPAGVFAGLASTDLRRLDRLEREAGPGEVRVDELVVLATRAVREVDLGEPSDDTIGAPLVSMGGDRAGRPTALASVVFTRIDGPPDLVSVALDRIDEVMIDGRVIDTHGAGHVVVFESCQAAVAAARDLHALAADLSARAGSAAPVHAGVSIAVGEMLRDGDDEFGGAVVEAARLLELAGDATVFSDAVRVIAGELARDAVPLGGHQLKGLPGMVAVHRLASTGAARPLVELPAVFRRDQRFGLAGRGGDLGALRAAWADVVAGDLRGVVVSGEEGVGKTRLVRELGREVVGRGATVLYGACDEDLRRPYGPIAMALRAAVDLDPGVTEAVRDRVGPLLPVFGQPSPGAGGDLDRLDVFDAIVAVLRRLAEVRPVLLVVDDVQWATPDSIEMIEHLLSDRTLGRVMVVALSRTEGLDGDAVARRLWRSTRTLHRVVNHRLDRLEVDDVVGMLESRAGAELAGDELAFARQITLVTGGNPLFVEELIVHLVATDVLVHGRRWKLNVGVDDMLLPDTLVDLMAHRLSRLGADAVRILSVAAVVGSTFDVGLVAAVAGRAVDDVLDAVDDAVVAGLLHEVDADDRIGFSDELSRAALLRDVRAARRSRWHRQIAEALEVSGPDAIDELAHHWNRAHGDDAPARAARYLLAAADRDMASAAWESAAARLERVLEGLDGTEAGAIDRGEVCYLLGSSRRMLGDGRHRHDLLAAARHARTRGDADLLARAAIAMMRPGSWYPEAGIVDEEIVQLCEEALLLLPGDDRLRAKVLAVLAINLTYDEDVDRCRSLVAEAQRLARERHDLDAIGTTIAAELIAIQDPELFEHRAELAGELHRIGRLLDSRAHRFTGGFFLACEHQHRGEVSEAEVYVEELREIAESTRSYWYRYLVAHFDTMLLIARRDPAARAAVADQSARAEKAPVDGFGPSVIQEAAIALADGTLAEMLSPFGAAMDQFGHVDQWAKKWNHPVARALLETGDVEAALPIVELQPVPDRDWYFVSGVCNLAWIGLHLRSERFCDLAIQQLAPHRRRFAIIGLGICVSGNVSTALGQAYLGLGAVRLSLDYFREGIEVADRAGFPYFATEARRYLAGALLQLDPSDPDVADLLERAEADARRYEFAVELRELIELRERRERITRAS